MGCIGQTSVGLGKLGEVIAGQCRMEKSIAGKGKSTYNSHLELSTQLSVICLFFSKENK